MSEKIMAPFTQKQADALNRYQLAGRMHPFTCPRGHHDDQTNLVAIPGQGWVCLGLFKDTGKGALCDYTQDWAHAFMLDPAMGTPWPQ